jgi:hypothetical protein
MKYYASSPSRIRFRIQRFSNDGAPVPVPFWKRWAWKVRKLFG